MSGCGKLDVNELTIVTAIGMDKSDTGGVKITAQILNAFVLARNPRPIAPVTVIDMEGDTVLETLRKFSTAYRSKLFLFHFQVLLIGEELAREGIEPLMNFFFTDNETRHKYNIVIAQGAKAGDILKVQALLSLIPIMAVESKLESAVRYYGITKETQIHKLVNDLYTEGVDITLGSLKFEGDLKKGETEDNVKDTKPPAYYYASDIGVFKHDKFLGYLTDKESIGYSYIMGEIQASVIPVTLDDGTKVTVEVANAKSKISLKMQNNQPRFTIDIAINGIIAEDMIGVESRHTEPFMREVETKSGAEVKKWSTDCIKKAQNIYGCDIFKLGSIIHAKQPQYWKQIKDNYGNVFKNISIDVNVNMKTIRIRY
jgi:spore germination protein KC